MLVAHTAQDKRQNKTKIQILDWALYLDLQEAVFKNLCSKK